MEPITQGILGAMGAQIKPVRKRDLIKISFWGALGGLAPDLDYIIRDFSDPLFTIEYHRQFTHSIFFIPFGALIVSWFLKLFKVPVKESYLFVLLGYATHGLLDSCTNYGTQLWWPFSNFREAWNLIAVIDPLFSIPLLFLLLGILKFKKQKLVIISWVYLFSYMFHGAYQRSKAHKLLVNNGILNNEVTNFMIKPTIANNFVWRVIVQRGQEVQFYAVRLSHFGESKIVTGEKRRVVKDSEVIEILKDNKMQLNDYQRFKYFTSGFLHWGKDKEIIDSRYSLLPYGHNPIWSITFKPEKHDEHILWQTFRRPSEDEKKKMKELLFLND